MQVADGYKTYLSLKAALEGFSLDEEGRRREADFTRFEVDEIENAGIRPGEEEELAARYRKFVHGQKIADSMQAAYRAIDTDEISRALREVESVVAYDDELQNIASGLADVESILSDLRRAYRWLG